MATATAGTATDRPTRLLACLAEFFTFVVSPTGQIYASRVGPAGFSDYAIESTAFRDVVRRLLTEQDEPFDDAVFAAVVQRLLLRVWTPPAPEVRSVKHALRALRAVVVDARSGHIAAADLYLLGAELRAVIEAANEHAAHQQHDPLDRTMRRI